MELCANALHYLSNHYPIAPLEEGLEAGETGGDDARVALGRDPDGEVGRVPEEVARLAVVGQEEGLDDGSRDGAGNPTPSQI